jgi:hypothetical protein
LVEITGKINDNMKAIDNDIKKVQDDLTEARNNVAQLNKKEGANFLTQDISEAIYSAPKLVPQNHFVDMLGSQAFSTVVAVVHKTKVAPFLQTYEKVIQWSDSGVFGAVPKSAKAMDIEDKDGFQLFSIVIFTEKLDEYIAEGRK